MYLCNYSRTNLLSICKQYRYKGDPESYGDMLGRNIWIPYVNMVAVEDHGSDRRYVWVK